MPEQPVPQEQNEPIQVLSTIRAKFDRMTPIQQRIARFILSQPERAFRLSISELAAETGARSESTLVRFYRLLGFTGYHDFKVTLATEIAGASFYHTYEDITGEDDVQAVHRKIFDGAARTLRDNVAALDGTVLESAVRLLEQSRRIVVLGYGTSGAVAYYAYFTFTALGLDCRFTLDSHTNAVLLSEPRPGDVVFCVSHSGESKDVVEPARKAKPQAKVIALTGYPNSQLGKIADVCITTYSEEMNYRSDAIISRVVEMTAVGALFAALSIRRGEDAQEKLRRTRQSISYLKY